MFLGLISLICTNKNGPSLKNYVIRSVFYYLFLYFSFFSFNILIALCNILLFLAPLTKSVSGAFGFIGGVLGVGVRVRVRVRKSNCISS